MNNTQIQELKSEFFERFVVKKRYPDYRYYLDKQDEPYNIHPRIKKFGIKTVYKMLRFIEKTFQIGYGKGYKDALEDCVDINDCDFCQTELDDIK